MAYQNVGTPRFYVNVLEWLNSNGSISISNIFRTLPVNVQSYHGDALKQTPNTWNDGWGWKFNKGYGFTEKSFFAILGVPRDVGALPPPSDVANPGGRQGVKITTNNNTNNIAPSAIINNEIDFGTFGALNYFDYSGFSMGTFNGIDLADSVTWEYHLIARPLVVGSVVLGTYYDMQHSPDLSLTMSREYGGTKTIETKGGASLSNSCYTKSPAWGRLGAWELEIEPTTDQGLARSGRRIWSLSFSFLDKGDIFGANQSLTNYGSETQSFLDTGAYEDSDYTPFPLGEESLTGFAYNILTDDSFFSQVIHKTNGGQLPFIFQPDNNSRHPDNFAICKLDMKSFKFDQVANGVYNMKLKIREVW